jgi:hypothetical protein
MRSLKLIIGALVAFIAIGIAVIPAQAQTQGIISAEVDRSRVTTDDTITLTVLINETTGIKGQPSLPPLDGFQVIGTSSGTRMSIVNGNMSVNETYQYRLRPLHAGTHIIEPITLSVNGQVFGTPAITIEVIQGNGQPTAPPSGQSGLSFPTIPGFPNITIPNFPSMPGFPSLQGFPSAPDATNTPSGPLVPMDPNEAPAELLGRDYYLEAEVSDNNPYQGQQIVYTLRLYQPNNGVLQPEYQAPSFTGFWSKTEPVQTNYSLQLGGRNYRVLELNTILVPTIVGQADIDPTTIDLAGGFFSSGQRLRSKPVIVDVRSLPDGAPASFQGAVGQFEIAAQTDKPETVVNDTIIMNVAVAGAGNLDTMGDPQWLDLPGWRAFDSDPVTESRIENGVLTGVKKYERVMVPTQAGQAQIPPVEFTFFDPETGQYHSVATQPIPINIIPDGSSGQMPPSLPAGNIQSTGLPGNYSPELLPLKETSSQWNIGDRSLIQNPGYWILWTLPLLVLGVHAGWRLRRRNRLDNAAARKSQQAKSQALKSLKGIKKQSVNQNEEAGRILISYLENKLNRSLGGLTHPAVSKILSEREIPESILERLQFILLQSEMGRYAPSGLEGFSGNIISDTEELIKVLEKAL